MSGPPTGMYEIVRVGSSAPPPFPIGADNTSHPVEPVIAGGKSKVWFVKMLENGKYLLYLDQGGRQRIGFGEEDKVFVGDVRLIAEWAIQKQEGSEESIYKIQVPDDLWPARAWTLESTAPGTEVKLKRVEFWMDEHLWIFKPVIYE